MSSYQDITRQIGDQWIETLKRTEDVVNQWAERSSRLAGEANLPTVPPLPEPFAQFNASMKDRMPKPSEVVEANFELTERLLTAQKELTLNILRASADTAESVEEEIVQDATKAGTKTSGNKKN